MGSVIALSGTPGTGKTVIGQLLASDLNAELIELNQIIIQHQFHKGEDPKRRTLIADVQKLQNYLSKQLDSSKKRYIVVGHFADEVPDNLLEVLVVLRCNPLTLTQRLKTRGWSTDKILENIQAEILGECTAQALARHSQHQIFEIDTTTLKPSEVVEVIHKILAGTGRQYSVGEISWLRSLDPNLVHQIMEEKTLPSKPQKA
ncbi:MAG: adenylate kinase family protein [Promethearchaeota archaeon]